MKRIGYQSKKEEFTLNKVKGRAIKLELRKNKKQIARAYLYLIKNDLHKRPYGLLEVSRLTKNTGARVWEQN